MLYNKLLDIAEEQALKSEHNSFKHGAVLFHGKHILSKGFNKSTIDNGLRFHSLHAEMSAVKSAKRIFKTKTSPHSSLLVIRINKSGDLLHSLPCVHCQKILKDFGVKRVLYSNNNGQIVSQHFY